MVIMLNDDCHLDLQWQSCLASDNFQYSSLAFLFLSLLYTPDLAGVCELITQTHHFSEAEDFSLIIQPHHLSVSEEFFSNYSTTLLVAEEIFTLYSYSHIHWRHRQHLHSDPSRCHWICPYHSRRLTLDSVLFTLLRRLFYDLVFFTPWEFLDCLNPASKLTLSSISHKIFIVLILTWSENDEDAGADQQLGRTRPLLSMASWELNSKQLPNRK